jgi:AsmA protein
MDLPVDAGSVGLDVAFTTRGATKGVLLQNLDGNGTISLVNGHLKNLGLGDTFGDPAADEIDDVDMVAEFSSLAAPVTAKGGFTWHGERFSATARGEPRALGSGVISPVAITATSKRAELGFTGEANLAGLGNGTVSLSTASLRDLLAWIGRPLAPGGGLGPFSIDGKVRMAADSFTFEEAAFMLDGSSGIGAGQVMFGEPPTVNAGLAIQTLDVTPYLVASDARRGSGLGGNPPAGGSGNAGGRSDDRIAFDGLRAIDANVNLKATEIIADDIKAGPTNITLVLAGGRLKAELSEMELYSGTGAGVLIVDASTAAPSVSASFRLLQLSALPFLTDAFGFSRIEGTGSFSFDLHSSGESEAALIAALDGKGAIDFSDGAIRGINIPKMVQNLSIETLLGWQTESEERTDFSQLSGSYAITDGILTNNDLVMVGPLMRVTGAGRVDLAKRTLAYRVDPKIVASLDGQGNSENLEGFAVPIRVEGSWDKPRIYPEIEGILQDPQKALDQLRKLGGDLFGGKNGDAPQTEGEQSNPGDGGKSVEDEIPDKAKQEFDKLFGGSKSTGEPQPHPSEDPVPPPSPGVDPAPTEDPADATEPPLADPATDFLKSLLGQ